MRLAGKRALITAAGQGIGRAAALMFAREGAEVLAADINDELLAVLDRENVPGLRTVHLDVTDKTAVRALIARHGTPETAFNVLFNIAGVVHAGSILECTDENWEFAWQLNVSSMYYLCKAVIPGMLEAGGGSIINVSSIASSVKGVPNRFVYGTTKAAVIGFTKHVAIDFVSQGLRCNAICPGTVESPSLMARMTEQARTQNSSLDNVYAAFKARQPIGRLGKPEEIAALGLFLASDESAFITGAIHMADGGWCI